ncbi:MAG: hypothetical protein HC836_44740 [Richelia sp. RM2_1_2]|nr:hypothetical protein [Richelia sp. SM2_1_7]NJO64974.1 hypothetical protein [Richelia sp. RM2_1_2]
METLTELLLQEFMEIYDQITPWSDMPEEKLAEIALRILEMKENRERSKGK